MADVYTHTRMWSELSRSRCRVRTSQQLFVSSWPPVRIFAFERNRSKHAKDPRKWKWPPGHVNDSRTSRLLPVAVHLILSVIFRTKVRSYFSATIYDLVRRESERASARASERTEPIALVCAPKTVAIWIWMSSLWLVSRNLSRTRMS